MRLLDWTLDLFDTYIAYNYWLQFSLWCYRQFSITIYIALSLFHNYCIRFAITRTESSRSAIPHKSSGTGFQRQMFPFLCSRTIPIPQSQRLSALSIFNCFLFFRSVLSGALPVTDYSGALSNNWLLLKSKSKSHYDRHMSRPVRLGVRRPSGTRDQISYLFEILC
jgi:hypothetical protein